jgi:hypothetical protein
MRGKEFGFDNSIGEDGGRGWEEKFRDLQPPHQKFP